MGGRVVILVEHGFGNAQAGPVIAAIQMGRSLTSTETLRKEAERLQKEEAKAAALLKALSGEIVDVIVAANTEALQAFGMQPDVPQLQAESFKRLVRIMEEPKPYEPIKGCSRRLRSNSKYVRSAALGKRRAPYVYRNYRKKRG